MKHQRIRIFFLLIGLFLLIHSMDFVKVEVNLNAEKKIYKNVKISNLYNTTIQIDDLSNSIYDWEWAESQSWCSGSGTKTDPYIIENQVFAINNSGATCLSIKNSEKYFIIENCSFFDTLLSRSGSGIYLYNVTNAKVINSIMHHKYQGIYLDNSYNNLISGNNLTNNRKQGILTVESGNNNISKNLASFNEIGIFLAGFSDYNTLIENNCSENSIGIKLFYADYNSIIKSKLLNNGIDVERSNYNTFSENIVLNSGVILLYSNHISFNLNDIVNSGVSGYHFSHSSDNILFGCNILSSGLSGITFFESQRNKIVNNFIENSGEYGIRLYCHIDGTGNKYNDFLNNSILNSNKHGIYLEFSPLNNFYNNIIQGNKESGLYAYISHRINFENNTVNYNTLHGVEAYCDSNYNIIGNEIKYNGLNGLYLHRYSDRYNITNNIFEGNVNVGLSIQDLSYYSSIFNNYFINNGQNADDSESDNYWNCSYIGNYWNDYTGIDENNDGIGDTPYAIGQGTDYLPIVDIVAPSIIINSPMTFEVFGEAAPNFNVEISDLNLDTMWYTIDNGVTNIIFSLNGTISQALWDALPEGSVVIKFYANDTLGRIGFAEVTIKKDVTTPSITIQAPFNDEVFRITAPDFVIEITELNLDTMWYTINNGISNITITENGTILQSAWEALPEGNIIIRFYANDTLGRIGSQAVTIEKDVTAPVITIQSPFNDENFGINAPDFVIEITELNLDSMWFTVNSDITNITFTENGTILQSAWEALPEGNVIIRFYANDSAGNIHFQEVTIEKDITTPTFTIHSPFGDEDIGINAPDFIVEISDLNLDSMWYNVNGGITNTTFTENGTILQSTWDALPEGDVIIRFYANDSVGNVDFQDVTIEKDVTVPAITIQSPTSDEVIGINALDFIVEINELNLDSMWYTVDSGISNITFTENETISQSAWEALPEGEVIIRFYANDSAGNKNFQEVTVKKDITPPIIIIQSPLTDKIFGINAPDFIIEIAELDLDSTWYTVDGGISNITFTENGTILQSAWDALPEGEVIIRFYAKDTIGRIGSQEVTIVKDVTAPAIIIQSPFEDEAIGVNAPDFIVEISEPNLDSMWYTLDSGISNITFTENGTISQFAWDTLLEGNVVIRFYINDSLGKENFQEVTIKKDVTAPAIVIQSPISDEVIGINAPDFIVEISELNLDTMWYTLDSGISNITFTENGTISQSVWDNLLEGNVVIRFYANDTLGRIGSQDVNVNKDITTPTITINSPISDKVFGGDTPDFVVEITELHLDSMWYTVDDGISNITFTENGTISQSAWDALLEGNVVIRFYANDSVGNINFEEVTIKKDVTSPIIAINILQNNDIIGITAPNYDLSIDEPNLEMIWYSLNGGPNITITELTGTIDQSLWDVLPEGDVIIKFYANDTLGRIGFREVSVIKDSSQPTPPGIPGYDLLFLVGIISVMVIFIIKKKVNHLK